jgi:hypothetical protein
MMLLAAVIALAGGLVAYSPAPVGVFWDDAVYVISAKALATGEGYRYIHLPGAPAATHYPPLWPWILSLVWRVGPEFPENVRLMKALNPLFLGVGAAGTALLAMRVTRLPAWACALVAGGTTVVAPMLLLSAVLMSEPLAFALTAPALVAATMVVMRGRMRDGAIAGALVGMSILARSAAIVLVPALLVGILWKRSRRAALVSTGVALALAAPWFVWSSVHAAELPAPIAGSYGPYGSWLIDGYRDNPSLIVDVIARNAVATFSEFTAVVFGAFPRPARPPLLSLMLATTITGLCVAGRRIVPLVVAMAGYFALVLVWPYAPGRFVWAYYPLYAVAAAAAASALVRRARTRGVWRAPAGLAAVAAACAVIGVVRYDIRGFQRGWHSLAIEPLAEGVLEPVKWIATYTRPTDTIASDVHLQAYLYAGRIGTPVSSLTVEEYVNPKPPAASAREYTAIDSIYRPHWWIATHMTSERFAIADWASRVQAAPRFVTEFPGNGLAVRVRP